MTPADASRHLPQAVPMVSGGYWMPRAIISGFVESVLASSAGRRSPANMTGPSRRETEVPENLLENLSNKEIANKLFISERTVKFHVSNLLAKFRVRRRADLILYCYQREPQGNRAVAR